MNVLYQNTKEDIKRLTIEIRQGKRTVRDAQRANDFSRYAFNELQKAIVEFQIKHIAMSLYRGKTLEAIGNFDSIPVASTKLLNALKEVDNERAKALCASAQ